MGATLKKQLVMETGAPVFAVYSVDEQCVLGCYTSYDRAVQAAQQLPALQVSRWSVFEFTSDAPLKDNFLTVHPKPKDDPFL